ncbi:hypothetical protein [Methylobacterium platani]|uniref:Uncharacterized protein n=2 Tax=Methylobacterium platani TaxID=427683 RepID=A0A179S8D9_9HYPH|nr:hypothetical protein [Methylobacterium platani]KMO14754.1 hypothetical protein SQ03_18920 [Methylobacterium platani JCM 14648]OAS23906.1 hypothetical protein A5481_15765 [Methylobacterium platani]
MGYHHDDHDDGEQDPFIQEFLKEIAMDAYDPPEPEPKASEPEPEPAGEDETVPEPVADEAAPVAAPPLSASAEAAAHRRVEAERKRIERAERRAAGLPDRRTVDGAVSAALAQVLREGKAASRVRARGSARGMVVDGEAILRHAILELRARACSKEAASRAVAERLLGRDTPGPALASG